MFITSWIYRVWIHPPGMIEKHNDLMRRLQFIKVAIGVSIADRYAIRAAIDDVAAAAEAFSHFLPDLPANFATHTTFSHRHEIDGRLRTVTNLVHREMADYFPFIATLFKPRIYQGNRATLKAPYIGLWIENADFQELLQRQTRSTFNYEGRRYLIAYSRTDGKFRQRPLLVAMPLVPCLPLVTPE